MCYYKLLYVVVVVVLLRLVICVFADSLVYVFRLINRVVVVFAWIYV